MPKIIDEDAYRIRENRFKRTINLAAKMVGDQHVSVNRGLEVVDIHKGKLLVYSSRKLFLVNDSSQKDLAFDLATCLEDEFKIKYTIKLVYR